MLSIKQARLLSGKTQKEIADNLGVHVQTYRKLEKNPDTATVSQAKKISQITGVSLDNLFFIN